MKERVEVKFPVFPIALMLSVMFMVMKMCGVIDWDWIWVFAPLWVILAGYLSVWLIGLVIVIIYKILK